MKKQLDKSDESAKQEREELGRTLTNQHQLEVQKMRLEHETAKEKAEIHAAGLSSELHRLREAHEEDLLVSENSTHQTAMMAQQQLSTLKERLSKIASDFEASQDELERVKRESTSRREKDQGQLADLQLEVSRLRGLLEDAQARLKEERDLAEDKLLRHRHDQTDSVDQISVLRTSLKLTGEKMESLVEELAQAKTNQAQVSAGQMLH